MYVEVLEVLAAHRFWTPVSPKLAVQRMQRYNTVLERLISPEGTYPRLWPLGYVSHGRLPASGAGCLEIRPA